MKILDETVLDKKSFWMGLGILVLLTPLQKISGGNAYVLTAPFALAAIFMRKIESVMFWLMLSMLFIVGNEFFLPRSVAFYVTQRGVFMLLGAQMLVMIVGMRKSPQVFPLVGMIFYIAFSILSSSAGWNPPISFLKLLLFSVIYFGYLGISNLAGASPSFNARKVRSTILAVAVYLIVGSILLIPFPSIGQLTGEQYLDAIASGQHVTSLFKGMTMHSQTLGPVVASFFAFLFADLAINVRKMNWLYIALLVCCPLLIIKTSSRTAMASMLMSVLMVGGCVMKMKGIGVRWRGKVKAMLGAGAVFAIVAICFSASVRQSIIGFAMKYGEEASAGDFSMEYAMGTRQFLIDAQLYNFKKSPYIGNGFQVSEEMAYTKTTSFKDLISAPIEKGVWVTAVLEEGGVIGFTILVLFFLVAILTMLQRGAYTGVTVLSALVVSNLAEFTMFSMSAMGGLFWALVFIGAAMDTARIKQDKSILAGRVSYYGYGRVQ